MLGCGQQVHCVRSQGVIGELCSKVFQRGDGGLILVTAQKGDSPIVAHFRKKLAVGKSVDRLFKATRRIGELSTAQFAFGHPVSGIVGEHSILPGDALEEIECLVEALLGKPNLASLQLRLGGQGSFRMLFEQSIKVRSGSSRFTLLLQ